MHLARALGRAGQALPQVPQCFGSVTGLAHTGPQRSIPTHTNEHELFTHTGVPWLGAVQETPQPPQLS